MYCTILRVDDEMIVSNYTSDPNGFAAPTLRLVGRRKPLFKRYVRELDDMFRAAELPLIPEHRSAICDSHNWDKVLALREALTDVTKAFPSPATVVVYPTYKCTAKCSYCMYASRHRVNHNGHSMPLAQLRRLVAELHGLGVDTVEFSGGGEPTQYPQFDQLLEIVRRSNADSPSAIRFGLLTNGTGLDPIVAPSRIPAVVGSFAYCRLSFYGKAEKDGQAEAAFRTTLDALVAEKARASSPIALGLKFLLHDENADGFVARVKKFCDDYPAVAHVKVKSVRDTARVPEDVVLRAEDALYDYVLTRGTDVRRRLQVDLRRTPFERRPKFRCWLNPLVPVVDPHGVLFVCWNYVGDEDAKEIGRISDSVGFAEVWGTAAHRATLRRLTLASCTGGQGTTYCNCRVFDYQEVAEDALVLSELLRKRIAPASGPTL